MQEPIYLLPVSQISGWQTRLNPVLEASSTRHHQHWQLTPESWSPVGALTATRTDSGEMEPTQEPLQPSEFELCDHLSHMMQSFVGSFIGKAGFSGIWASATSQVILADFLHSTIIFIGSGSIFKVPLTLFREIRHSLEDLQQYLEKHRSRKTKLDLTMLSKMEEMLVMPL